MPTLSNNSYENNHFATPYVSSAQTRFDSERLQEEAEKADEQPLRYLPHRDTIEALLAKIDSARENGADWDDQEGQPVSFDTAKRAKTLLRDAALRAEGNGKVWTSPAISATPTGGIHFSWLISGSRVTLTIFAPYQDTVCVSKLQGEASRRELLSDYGAVGRVLQAFQTSAFVQAAGNRQ
jgi:hypothetical protein